MQTNPVCFVCEQKLKLHCQLQQHDLVMHGRWVTHFHFFRFHKLGVLQKLLFHLKYKGRQRIAPFLIQIIYRLSNQAFSASADYLWIPVPLHPLKQKKRGYNQAAELAKELAESYGGRCLEDGLLRVKNSKSQTKMTLRERQANVENAFQINPKANLQDGKIVLVDDVFTTGATLASCFLCLVQNGFLDVRFFTLTMRQ